MATGAAVEIPTRTFLNHFRETVEVCRHDPALVQGTLTLTYAELDQRSNAVARILATAGVGPDSLVGLLMDRSPDLLVALLGILKAGGAYLPLDADLPAERLACMLDDARPAIVVTRAALVSLVPSGVGRMCIDTDPALRGQATDPPIVSIDAEHRAYVLYTSGSTGTPKGVEITHRSIANLIEAFAEAPGLTRADRVLAHVTLSFDISVIELLLPLTVGACIVLAPSPDNRDGHALVDLIARRRITFMTGTPSFFRMLLTAGWRDAAGVTIFCGGEPMSREFANTILATGATLWNAYGPTETTVWSSAWKVDRDSSISIGEPIRGTALHILDESLRPVPPGAAGELCISGAGLARGYLNRPTLTAEKFPHHPIGELPDGRIYRTGDEARRDADGRIAMLGRIDRQLKIDGFRIEPGEIESVLALHDGVDHALVRAVERSAGDTRLVAYVVHGSNPPPIADDLLALARRRLPLHMVPSAFVMLSEAPLTPNGKVDVHRLPLPDWCRPTAPRSVRGPRTGLETVLTAIWREVLGLERIGVDDNFFDIGGRSRLGAAMFARIEQEVGVRLPLATLFESPTIASLAEAIERSGRDTSGWNTIVPIRAAGAEPPIFFVHPVGGNVLAYRDLVRHIDPDIPCYGIQAVGLDGIERPLESVDAMAARYLRDVRSRQPRGPYRLAGFSFGGLVAFEMARRLRAADERVDLLALLDTEFPEGADAAAVRSLARFALFRRQLYPAWLRARRHAASLRRLGTAGYVRATTASRRSASAASDPVRAANLRAAFGYIPLPYDGSLAYFRASQATPANDRRHRWTNVAPRADVIEIAGRHSDLRHEPHVRAVAAHINARLRPQPPAPGALGA